MIGIKFLLLAVVVATIVPIESSVYVENDTIYYSLKFVDSCGDTTISSTGSSIARACKYVGVRIHPGSDPNAKMQIGFYYPRRFGPHPRRWKISPFEAFERLDP